MAFLIGGRALALTGIILPHCSTCPGISVCFFQRVVTLRLPFSAVCLVPGEITIRLLDFLINGLGPKLHIVFGFILTHMSQWCCLDYFKS